jgi:heavy metal sensor kinase
LLSSLISWLLAGIAISPLVKIRTQVEQIRQGRLGKRVAIGPKGKEIEELVGVFNDMLEGVQHSIESQKRFTSAVSHEIRSPLTSLRGSMEVALRKKRTPEEYERLLRENLSDVNRLSRITDNLLFLAKADSKLLELRKQWFDLNQLVKNIIERMRFKALSAELTIVEEYQDNLELNGDGDLLEQALSNLLDNAIKYTPPGGKITVKTQKKDQTISVAVCDTGIGISEEEIQHIFKRFYRGEKDRVKKIVGTGLGLAISQWIIHAHEGKILVKSQMNSGSEFLVVFPITSDE